jgi:lysozyme
MPKQGELDPERKRKLIQAGGGGALATAALIAILPIWEGKRNNPYFDAVGVRTVCYGETRVNMRRYSDAECVALLEEGAKDFQAAVLKINPRLKSDPYQWAAHTSLAYNIGVGRYRKSSVARLYAAGQEMTACYAIATYRFAGKQELKGLKMRRLGDRYRLGEVELCLTPHDSLGVR